MRPPGSRASCCDRRRARALLHRRGPPGRDRARSGARQPLRARRAASSGPSRCAVCAGWAPATGAHGSRGGGGGGGQPHRVRGGTCRSRCRSAPSRLRLGTDRLSRRLPDRGRLPLRDSGLSAIPALEASLILLIEPALNPLWAWVFQGERPGPWALLGGALILGATTIKAMLTRARAAACCERRSWDMSRPDRDRADPRRGAPRSGTCICGGWRRAARRWAYRCRASCRRRRAAPTGSIGYRSSRRGVAGERAAGRHHRRSDWSPRSVVHRPYPHKTTDRGQFDRALDEARARRRGRRPAADRGRLGRGSGDLEPVLVGGRTGRVRRRSSSACCPEWPGPGSRNMPEESRSVGSAVDELRGRPLFVANAVRGVVPVASLDGDDVPLSAPQRSARARVLALTQPRETASFAARMRSPGSAAVVVAQSVRAPDCGSGGCGFDSRQPPW